MSTQLSNKELLSRFPFLLPQAYRASASTADCNFDYTVLDGMPDGWRIAFGESLCKEIMDELISQNCLDTYCVTQIEEKYGRLCWYDIGGTLRIHQEILPKYEALSMRTCVKCGRPAACISAGWVSPWCNDCAKDMPNEHFINVNDFYPQNKV